MAKTAKTTAAEPATAASDGTAAPKRSKRKMLIGGALGLVLCLGAGGYVAMPMALAMMGASDGGETAAAQAEAHGEAASAGAHGSGAVASDAAVLPVERIVFRAAASDYQIVSIYDGEAYLATPDNLIRIKVGSTAPGIGDILSITSSETGGTITGSLATLKTT